MSKHAREESCNVPELDADTWPIILTKLQIRPQVTMAFVSKRMHQIVRGILSLSLSLSHRASPGAPVSR